MNFCTKCGTKLKENARFCHNCGETVKIITAQKEPEAPVIPQIVLCSKCGKELRKGSRFCVSCGTPVDIQKQAVDKPQVAVPLSSNPLQAQPVPVQPLKKKSSGKKAVIVISIIVFLGLVGAVGWYFFGDKIFKALKSERPEYIVQKVVPGTTTVETKEISGKKGSDVNVKLSDESGVVIRSLKNDIKIKFVRDNNNIKTGSSSVVTSGSMRSLTLEGNGDITSVKPVITFPKSEVGSINPATINIVRVSDVVDADGSVIRDQVDYLPVTLDKNGNYSAIDFMFPSTASSNNTTASTDIISNMLDLFVPSVFAENGNFEGLNWVANVKYSYSTFQGSLNWVERSETGADDTGC
jgi:uncharacterized membrane protein YvbJ